MAHSDTLIFLTNISWISLLFFFCYFFFVLFFLPTFYKKVRFRAVHRTWLQRGLLYCAEYYQLAPFLIANEFNKLYAFGLIRLAHFLKKNTKQLVILSFKSVTSTDSLKINPILKTFKYSFWLDATAHESRKFISIFTKLHK